MAERGVASTAARKPRTRDAGAAAGQMRPVAWSLRTGAGRQCRRWKRTLADSATVERREAASRLRGRAHASQAWRRALPARLIQGWRLSALRHPLGGGCKMKDQSPGRRKRRGRETSGWKEWWRAHPAPGCLTS